MGKFNFKIQRENHLLPIYSQKNKRFGKLLYKLHENVGTHSK
jgi:hypothetical protein